MTTEQEMLLKKIFRELQDIKIILQENDNSKEFFSEILKNKNKTN
ncbi:MULTISPECIES: hypothetical protein [Clostridium]|uniref:Uncharacterized protein n=1 Tax=Clostridium botulinum D str. 1873 TaxID=592027 RepID=A0A9P2LL17_CLOBO|nr:MULTISPECIES: hypothetical protein [Clostridium]EES91073.1 conserved hypothetical protein [Clostridium botulinum D str. 1873]